MNHDLFLAILINPKNVWLKTIWASTSFRLPQLVVLGGSGIWPLLLLHRVCSLATGSGSCNLPLHTKLPKVDFILFSHKTAKNNISNWFGFTRLRCSWEEVVFKKGTCCNLLTRYTLSPINMEPDRESLTRENELPAPRNVRFHANWWRGFLVSHGAFAKSTNDSVPMGTHRGSILEVVFSH